MASARRMFPRARRRGWIAAGAAVGLVCLGIVTLAGRSLVVTEAVAQPEAIMSLASHEWERLPDAAKLAVATPKARVLLTQPIRPNLYNCHDCDNRINRLVVAGVDRERIEVLPRRVYRTLDEAQAFREWAQSRGVRSVVVVTSAYHTRRALGSFRYILRGSGITVGVYPAAAVARPGRWWGTPYDRYYVFYEWRARLFYLIRFGVW